MEDSPTRARVMASDARAYKHVFVAGNATILHADLDACYASVEQRDDPLERSRGVQPRRRPPRPAHVHALSADAPRRGLTRRDCVRLRLNQTRRPRPARTDRVERPRDSPIRAERRVPITRRTRRFACPSRAVLQQATLASTTLIATLSPSHISIRLREATLRPTNRLATLESRCRSDSMGALAGLSSRVWNAKYRTPSRHGTGCEQTRIGSASIDHASPGPAAQAQCVAGRIPRSRNGRHR